MVTDPAIDVTASALPYVSMRPSVRTASWGLTGSPSGDSPHATAVKAMTMTLASPTGTELNGKKETATVASLPVVLARAIAGASAPRKRGAPAYGAPLVTDVIWTLVWSKVTLACAPLVNTSAFWTTLTKKDVSFATVCMGGSMRSVLPAANTPATTPNIDSTIARTANIPPLA